MAVAAPGPAASRVAARAVDCNNASVHHADAAFCASTAARAPARHRAPVPDQAPGQQRSSPGQPPRHRPERPPQALRRLPPGLALQVAEHDGQPIVLRQAAQLLVQERQPVVLKCFALHVRSRHRLLLGPAARAGRSGGPRREASRPGRRAVSAAALRTRTRKVAWKASSASAAFPRTRRHTPSTIGPCRRTRATKAASSRRERNWLRSCPSVWSAQPRVRSARTNCAIPVLVRLAVTGSPGVPWARFPLILLVARAVRIDTRFPQAVLPGHCKPCSGGAEKQLPEVGRVSDPSGRLGRAVLRSCSSPRPKDMRGGGGPLVPPSRVQRARAW